MASNPHLDDDYDFGGEFTGTNNARRSGTKRSFDDLEDEDDDLFGSKKGNLKAEEATPGAATGMILSLRESLQNCKDSLATCQMSIAADSPDHSSSSEDLAAFLEAELNYGSSDELQDEDDQEFTDLESDRVNMGKVNDSLEDIQESTSYGSLQKDFDTSTQKEICTHPGSFEKMCILCGEKVDEESGVAFGYIRKGLRLGDDEVVRLRNSSMKNLLRQKKLYLVLDLDHTLLNSTQINHLTAEEEYLKCQTDSLEDVSKGSLFTLRHMHTMTKLRPFVRTFLEEANSLFEMYVYTMGERAYAWEMAKLLDPARKYFGERVISRDDGTQRHQKGLDMVLGQESAVLILDDTEHVWPKHKENLILMERYHFFASSYKQFGFNSQSLSEEKKDEDESKGALATILAILKRVHSMFYDELKEILPDRDVRQVLMTVRKEILKDCKIVFTRVFPTNYPSECHHLWKMAKRLGATCVKEVDPSVTHVISTDAGTEKSRWAVKESKFLVNPQWLEASNYLWQRQPEENFLVSQEKSQ